MPGAGPPGGPAQGWRRCADIGDGSLPSVSPRRRRLTRRPGYMRSTAGPGIGFLSPAGGISCWVSGGPTREEFHHADPRAAQCSVDPTGWCQRPSVESPVLKSSSTPVVASVDHLTLTQTSVRDTRVCIAIQPRAGSRLPEGWARPHHPGDTGRQREFPSMDSPQTRGPGQDAAWSEDGRGLPTVGSLPSPGPRGSGLHLGTAAPPSPLDSSFSFIRLSLHSAGERGEAEGCLPCREAESPHWRPQGLGSTACSSDRPCENLCLPRAPHLPATQDPADHETLASEISDRPEGDIPSSLDTDGGPSSLDPSSASHQGDKGSDWADAQCWDTVLREWEPALQGCLLHSRRQLEIASLSLKLQKLQEKAIEDEDYDEAEMLRQRLEDLEQEKGRLPWAPPSKQPAISVFLSYLAQQARGSWQEATQRASSDLPGPLGGTPRSSEPVAQHSPSVSVTRHDWLLQEKQRLQKELEALQARMSALEAMELQLTPASGEPETPLQSQARDLASLAAHLSPGQLQEVSTALGDSQDAASQVPFCVEPPGTLKSLQERTRSLELAVKDVTTQVCSSKRLCSSLRKRLSHLDTQLPALLEAKTLAISGRHFCTAKELTEEIRALASEREGLEALLDRLQALSSKSLGGLRSVSREHSRCRRELARQEAAHKASVKDGAETYIGALEAKLRSCRCPLLGRLWEADLEACRLLVQSLQLQGAESSPPAEAEEPMNPAGEAAWTAAAAPPRPCTENPASQAFQLAPSPCHPGGEQKEEPRLLSADLGEECKAIDTQLRHLEDQLNLAIHSHDEKLFQSLRSELQAVKETLQAMIPRLQPAEEEGEGEATARQAQTKPRVEDHSVP